MKKIDNLVAGKWGSSDHFFSSTNASFAIATRNEVARSVEAAHEVFPFYGNSTLKIRAAFLGHIIEALTKEKEAILMAYQTESQLTQGRAEGEFGRTIHQIQCFVELLEQGDYLQATLHHPEEGAEIRKMLQPIGPVAVFGASNFPLAFSTAGGDTISALAAGCPVIVKAHPYHPMTSFLVAQAIHAAVVTAGLPLGVFSHLQSDSHSLGQALVEHPQLCGVGFTGSFKGGKALYDLAQQRPVPIPLFAEMGSINPMVLFPGMLSHENVPQELGDSICLGSGQFCTNPGLIIAFGEHSLLDKLETKLTQVLLSKEAQPMVHEAIAKGYKEKLTHLKGQLKLTAGAQAALGVVTAKQFLNNPVFQEELFGPYSLLVRCSSLEEVKEILLALDGQLTLSLLGTQEDQPQLKQLLPIAQQKAGRILFQGVPTGVAVTQAMMHGGPFPASTDGRFSAVGTDAIYRWLRPVSYQDCPEALLPLALQKNNPLGLMRKVNGKMTKEM